MAYCTPQDIEAYYLNKEFDCDGWVTNSQVNGFIAQENALINSTLRTRYSLPITDSEDLQLLKAINEALVVGTIDGIFRERTKEGEFDRNRSTRKEALKMLDQIKKGELLLSTTGKDSVLKFNTIDSNGDVVEKRFKDANIQPTGEYVDRERKTVTRVSS